ncbi:LOW QUALITY PROTEIN: sorting nexin-7 [Takifugu flavidus]|uniref:LOW QUALITY PROTEIN: sorting nexin-7 n=1 Tax=Takifugu flavidus TaxID=433684 RepID=UPI002544C1DB|nr:LOW QUALITY PROTEIN: sorting nexin-7 [Takifugu flavidus]
MSGQAVPVDLSGHMLDLEEDEDLEVFSKHHSSAADGGSMPNSPSSMVNQYRLEDEEDELVDTMKDLLVTVDQPESHVTAIETFIVYRVVTKTTRSEFDSSEYEVRRRYQDFLWLRGRLEDSYPTLIVNPLPEKFVMKGMVERFNDDFIETRRKALDRFLNKVSAHPVLSHSQHLHVFLTAQDLLSHRKQGPGFLSRVGETVRAVANSVRGLKSRPEEFTLMHDYVEEFSSKISSVDKITQRIAKEQREYVDELKRCGPTYSLWAALEEDLAEPLRGVAGCVERCCVETEEHIQYLSEVLVPAVHEYVLSADTVKAVMRRRDTIHADYEVKNEALALRKDEPQALEEEVGRLAERLELANSALKGDWSCRWQEGMRGDLRSAFVSATEKNIQYYEKCLAVWESFLLSQRAEPQQ